MVRYSPHEPHHAAARPQRRSRDRQRRRRHGGPLLVLRLAARRRTPRQGGAPVLPLRAARPTRSLHGRRAQVVRALLAPSSLPRPPRHLPQAGEGQAAAVAREADEEGHGCHEGRAWCRVEGRGQRSSGQAAAARRASTARRPPSSSHPPRLERPAPTGRPVGARPPLRQGSRFAPTHPLVRVANKPTSRRQFTLVRVANNVNGC